MTMYFDRHGIGVFVFSPRHVDPDSGRVFGFVREHGRFVQTLRSVPEVNGNWYLGADKSAVSGGMGGRAFRAWAKERGVELYPDAGFTDRLRDKVLTYQLIADVDPALHPHTETFTFGAEQLERFLDQSHKVFLKPRVGNKGNQIAVLSKRPRGLLLDYYDQTKQWSRGVADTRRALERLRALLADCEYVIQHGISLLSCDDAKFILRVIMLSDGERWHWVHKAVLAAPGSEIANTTQGGSNHPTERFLARVYGEQHVESIMAEVRRVCFGTIERMDTTFDYGLMEVGYDLVIDAHRRVFIIEINTRPGMTKPGMPMDDAFGDIFNRTAEEDALYEKLVAPHGTLLARFLHAKLDARLRDAAPAVSLNSAPQHTGAAQAHDRRRLGHAIRSAAAYLTRACGADGMFAYRVNRDAAGRARPRYDVARHAGALATLCDCLERTDDPALRAAIERAATFLRNRCLVVIAELPGCAGVRALPGLETDTGHDVVKIGAVGLGLRAFAGMARHAPDLVGTERLRELGRFLLRARNLDGGFASAYAPALGGFQDRPASLHAPGQAAVGLACLYDRDPDPAWIDAALTALLALGRSRLDQSAPPADCWTLLATARVLDVARRHSFVTDEDALIHDAARICESILAEQQLNPREPGTFGGFSPQGRTAPSAIRLEALLAAIRFLPARHADIRHRVENAIRHGLAFLLDAQVSHGEHAGGIPRAVARAPGKGADAARFNRRAGEIRIDYVEHALAAFLQCERAGVPAWLPAGAGERGESCRPSG